MANRIDHVDARKNLAPRRAPYWHRLSTGCHLGYRKMSPASEGTWIAQAYDPATQRQTRRSLGAFDNLPPHQRFDAAKRSADQWIAHMAGGGSPDMLTVRQTCEAYVAHTRSTRGEKAARDIEARLKRWVFNERLASIPLPKLTRHHVEAWRGGLAKTPVVVDPHAAEPRTRKRSASSVNRDMTALRAALNYAHDHGQVTNDLAWRVALRPIENADGRRDAYLDRGQRTAIIRRAPADVALFLKALALVPLRPGTLAALRVAQFDRRLGVLTIGQDKAGRDRKLKLPPVTAALFSELCKGKLPTAPILARADGKAWNKDAWKKPVKAAAQAVGLPDSVTAYAMRHSAITDLVVGGLDLLTVAQLSGTSVAMIERHYGHLRADHAAAALAKLAL